MRWNRITGLSGVSYYSGRIGDDGCKYIYEHDGKWYVSRDSSFKSATEAMNHLETTTHPR